MPLKFMILETNDFKFPKSPKAEAQIVNCTKDPRAAEKSLKDSAKEPVLVFAPRAMRKDKSVADVLQAGKPAASVAFFGQAEDLLRFIKQVEAFQTTTRSVGVKDFLEPGSTIFSDTIFNVTGIGTKLDSCFTYAKENFDLSNAVDAWGSLQATVFLGLKSLPKSGEAGSGEKIDIQIGSDENCLAFTVRFDLTAEYAQSYRRHALLKMPRNYADIIEIAYLDSAKKMEVVCLFFKKEQPESTIEIQTYRADASLENSDFIKEFQFKPLSSMTGPKTLSPGKGFKRKFSEKIGKSQEALPADLLSSDAISAEALGIDEDDESATGRKLTIMLSKLESMQNALKQREELVARLNKEIEEIKDPLKMNVITNIKDNQVEGLKDNVKRLETELAELQAREKDLLAIADKTVQQKDEAVKKMKDLEAKLRQAQEGNSAKAVALEKQLEASKQTNKELTKKITMLTEQAAGKKVA